MPDPLNDLEALDAALVLAGGEARRYLKGVGAEPVMPPDAERLIEAWNDPFPEDGDGALVHARRAGPPWPGVGGALDGPTLLPLRDGRWHARRAWR